MLILAKARFDPEEWQKEGLDPEKCQKQIFAPARRSSGGPAHFVNLVF